MRALFIAPFFTGTIAFASSPILDTMLAAAIDRGGGRGAAATPEARGADTRQGFVRVRVTSSQFC